MNSIRYTLLADGPSDRCLVRIINWLLETIPAMTQVGVIAQVADFRWLRNPPAMLAEKMRCSVKLYPCDVLFVHRDAEREPREKRIAEINQAVEEARVQLHIPVIPVRMTEAWLLIDEQAIRRAADNPNGAVALELPPLTTLEQLPDPKAMLRGLLVAASEKTGRRLDQFRRDLNHRVQRVAQLIGDFVPLRALSAFRAFERETVAVLTPVARRLGEYGAQKDAEPKRNV